VSPAVASSRDRVIAGLAQLAPSERTLLALHFVDGCPVAEIAEILGVPERHVRRLIDARLAALAALLGARAPRRAAPLRKAS